MDMIFDVWRRELRTSSDDWVGTDVGLFPSVTVVVVVCGQNRLSYLDPAFLRPVLLRACCAECGIGCLIGKSEGVLAVVFGLCRLHSLRLQENRQISKHFRAECTTYIFRSSRCFV